MKGTDKKGVESNNAVKLEKVAAKDSDTASFIIPTKDEEDAVIRKLDRRLIPLVFILYTLAVLDRSNLGNAKLAGMQQDIDLSGNKYNWLGTIFYIAYILSQWLILGWKQFKPHHWAPFCIMTWGFVATIQAAAFNWAGLMVCRLFLGIAEAAFGPGVALYLTYFYPREKVGFRQGVFLSGAAMANAYGGALAYGISQIRGTLAPWQILFLIEGLPTCVFAVITFFVLPDSVREAKFLTVREKEVATHMVARNQVVDVGHERGVRLREIWSSFTDPKSFIPALCYFGCNVSFASLPLFIPTIISEIGVFDSITSQGLSAPPYVLSFFTIIFFCWLSDRLQVRGPFCFAAAMLSAIGFIINATTTGAAPRYFSLFLSVEIFASIAILLPWVANMNATESRRAGGYIILNLIGQCGPLLGTNVFPASEKPYYRKGMWISAAMCLMVAALSVVLSLWLIHENKKNAATDVDEDFNARNTDTIHGRQRKHRYIW